MRISALLFVIVTLSFGEQNEFGFMFIAYKIVGTLQRSPQAAFAAKHSQYFLRQLVFLHLQEVFRSVEVFP